MILKNKYGQRVFLPEQFRQQVSSMLQSGDFFNTNSFIDTNNRGYLPPSKPPNSSGEQYRAEYLKYMEHPSYKQRLGKELYGDAVIGEEEQLNIDRNYNERLNRVKKVPIYMKDMEGGKYIQGKIESSPNSLSHELSHAAEGKKAIEYDDFVEGTTKQVSYTDTRRQIIPTTINVKEDEYKQKEEEFDIKFETIQQRQKEKLFEDYNNKILFTDPNSKKNYAETLNDIKEVLDGTYNAEYMLNQFYFPSNEDYKVYLNRLDELRNDDELKETIYKHEEFIKTRQKEFNSKSDEYYYNEYLRSNTEIKARLNSLRLKAIKKYGFDLNEEFDIKKYPELQKENSGYEQLKNRLKMSDDQINELMKYTADSGSRKSTSNSKMA